MKLTSRVNYLDPSFQFRIELFDFVFLDWHSAVVDWGLPLQPAAVGGDVGDLQRALRPRGSSEDNELDPLFVEAVDVLGANEVLGSILAMYKTQD